jgi:oxalate decarboxylase/phosphoglucose isomerase-like protein (cupin superfamily)
MDFSANDVAFIPAMAGQHIQNTGDEDLVFLRMFVAAEFQKISPNQCLRALPQLASGEARQRRGSSEDPRRRKSRHPTIRSSLSRAHVENRIRVR